MTKSKSKSTSNGTSSNSGNRGPSSHKGTGGNWPSTTGNKSGGNRGHAPTKTK
ncbi:hypothetical protein N9W21_04025 [Shewanella sp.]|nr:hypothetical protein [Shewanella sp.]